jgi:PAS domain-containing protein
MSDLTPQDPSAAPGSFGESSPPASNASPDVSSDYEDLTSPYAPVLVLGPEGYVKHATNAARRLLQYSADQEFDDYFFTHVHGENLHRVMRDLAAMVKRGSERASWLLRMRTGRGRWRWYRAEAINRLSLTTPAVTVRLSNLHDW